MRGARHDPVVDDALRVLGAVLLDEIDLLADRLTLQILQHESCYGELGLIDELRDASLRNLHRGVQVLAGTVPDGVDPVDSTRETGRTRARQGVPLEAVLHGYRLGGRLIWEALLTASRQRFDGAYDVALLDAAGYIWRTNDGSSAVLVDAYRQEESRMRGHDLSRRRAALDGLLGGRGRDPGFVRDAAVVLGLPDTGPLLCAVGCVETAGHDPLHDPQETLAAQGIDSVWALRQGEMVGLVAARGRSAREIGALLEPSVVGRVGLSGLVEGLGMADAGYRMAQAAVRTLVAAGLAVLDDRLPEALLADSPELLPRVLDSALGGLLGLPAADRKVLLDTLDALLISGGSPTHAARTLFCHRNTVIYRLRRIEAVTGRRIADPRDRLLLSLGVMAARARPPASGRA
ncbi:MAG: hypothetical protein JWP64_719 [Pseudonocardia sp.]|nr:hypothetical protein [Pseudonocardia sp.]MDT7702055.1 hypothetical protein [Pseudonocardiales bacterium]